MRGNSTVHRMTTNARKTQNNNCFLIDSVWRAFIKLQHSNSHPALFLLFCLYRSAPLSFSLFLSLLFRLFSPLSCECVCVCVCDHRFLTFLLRWYSFYRHHHHVGLWKRKVFLRVCLHLRIQLQVSVLIQPISWISSLPPSRLFFPLQLIL